MKKIPCLFKRDYTKKERPLINEVLEGSEWVIKGEGIATKKYDGTCCLIKKGIFYKRYTLKRNKIAPEKFIPATGKDIITGKQFGWIPVTVKDKYHMEGLALLMHFDPCKKSGTFELCGPKIQGNPEKKDNHVLIKHGLDILYYAPRNFNHLKNYFKVMDIEGIVWHHPDGRMVKIKGVDFGINRKEQFKIYSMGADYIIIDDPLNDYKESKIARNEIWEKRKNKISNNSINDYNTPTTLTKINIKKLHGSDRLLRKIGIK